jgi:hypothetical protein
MQIEKETIRVFQAILSKLPHKSHIAQQKGDYGRATNSITP